MRKDFLPFARPDIGPEEIKAVQEVVASGWLTTGPRTKAFEETFARAVQAKHAVAVNSCTAAMHLALEAIGLQPGEEVITSTYTFAATAEVVRYFGARPVLVDICPETFNLNVEQVARAITAKTRAMIPVHVAGLPAALKPLYDLAERHSLAVIEDAAHAFPAAYGNHRIGQAPDRTRYSFPHAVAFSFYATKTLTTGEGGMLTTDSETIEERVRIMALHGISKDAWKRYTAEGSWYYEIIAPGYKYNMTDMASALGLVQLKRTETMRERREAIAQKYQEAFQGEEALEVPAWYTLGQHAWHLYMLRLNLDRLTIDRARFIEELKARNIGVSVHFIPLHLHPYYRDTYGYRPEDFPVAYQEFLREVSLPIYSSMSEQDVEDVIEAVLDVVGTYKR